MLTLGKSHLEVGESLQQEQLKMREAAVQGGDYSPILGLIQRKQQAHSIQRLQNHIHNHILQLASRSKKDQPHQKPDIHILRPKRTAQEGPRYQELSTK